MPALPITIALIVSLVVTRAQELEAEEQNTRSTPIGLVWLSSTGAPGTPTQSAVALELGVMIPEQRSASDINKESSERVVLGVRLSPTITIPVFVDTNYSTGYQTPGEGRRAVTIRYESDFEIFRDNCRPSCLFAISLL